METVVGGAKMETFLDDIEPEEVVHVSLLVILIALLQSRQYWNKAAPTSFQGRRFVTFHDACTTFSDIKPK